MICNNCGKEIDDLSNVCAYCGAPTNSGIDTKNIVNTNNVVINTGGGINDDKGGFLWCLLGFCVPIVGLVLYLIWKDQKPLTAKAAGKGALISVIIGVVFWILYFILIAVGIAVSSTGVY